MIAAREEWCSFCNKMHPRVIGGCEGFRKYFEGLYTSSLLTSDLFPNDFRDNLSCTNCQNNKPGATCHCTLGGNITY